MRKIKFRGKRLDNGEWVYGWLLTNKLGTYIITEENPHECSQYYYIEITEYYRVDPETVEEFTGCHDKNGKEVYEGNILSDGLEKWFVKHSVSESGFNADNRAPCNSIWSLWHLCHRHNCDREVEIIGDIHD